MNQPQLDRPGAGLPFPDNLIVRWWVGPFQSRQKDAATNLRLFKMAGARVLKEMAGVPAEKRDRKVLVPKMRGVEDSSRFWCATEVLEHLMITGAPMRQLIADLASGRKWHDWGMSDLAERDCPACRGDIPPLPRAMAARYLEELDGWSINAAGHLEKTYAHEGFRRGLEFVKKVGEMCEAQNHHGDLHLAWGRTRLEVWTHKVNGLVEADFIWAAKADALWTELG